MKVTGGLILDNLKRTPFTIYLAEKVHAGIGTAYEKQIYSEDEIFWACRILRRVVNAED